MVHVAVYVEFCQLVWIVCVCWEQTTDVPSLVDIVDAHVLLYLGDSVSADHISLAGSIGKNTPAGRYLASKGYVALRITAQARQCSLNVVSSQEHLSRICKCKTASLWPAWFYITNLLVYQFYDFISQIFSLEGPEKKLIALKELRQMVLEAVTTVTEAVVFAAGSDCLLSSTSSHSYSSIELLQYRFDWVAVLHCHNSD